MIQTYFMCFFTLIVSTILFFDLFFLSRKDLKISIKNNIILTSIYALIGISFGGVVWYSFGANSAYDYWNSYIVEKMLSMDNIFVMTLIFSYFKIPSKYHHRVLFWGILGVLFTRGFMIFFGSTIVSQFHFILYFFAAFLIYAGIKMFISDEDDEENFNDSKILNFLKKILPIKNTVNSNKFIIKEKVNNVQKTYITPLMLALIFIEIMDIVFAVDSVPAVFSITTNPFIVYTSNIFAIIGLRSLYEVINIILTKFKYLNHAVSIILIFIGIKIFLPITVNYEIPTNVSLILTLLILLSGVIFSLLKKRSHN